MWGVFQCARSFFFSLSMKVHLICHARLVQHQIYAAFACNPAAMTLLCLQHTLGVTYHLSCALSRLRLFCNNLSVELLQHQHYGVTTENLTYTQMALSHTVFKTKSMSC